MKEINFKDMGNGVYNLERDGVLIGYGKIIPGFTTNKLEIFIKPEFRGCGYGTDLFARLLNLIDDEKLTFEIDIGNTKAKRIITAYGGLHLSTTNGVEKYLLPHGKGKKYKRFWLINKSGDLVLVTLDKKHARQMRSHQKNPKQFTIEEYE